MLAVIGRRSVEETPWAYSPTPMAGAHAGEARRVRLQPYREWGNRGRETMRVFLPTA